ncbi:Similar to Gclm: Glutamate--cysteine ligase regulatory subunit (Rattus norvegicus) [Cotesia congregata]|uniref:GCS light chain n=1 Tax=Cotesia congregata TaxID=51543 RepID=A0A8J2HHX3_COTCN|nr:Similar to Gclm: Glutamate--cysteine ligase regulatory subunit (Rattus norvegicus) [Cotesia congregata]
MVSNSVLYNTGNILSLNELKLKAGKTSEEELVEALKIVLKDSQNTSGNDINAGGGDREELKITELHINSIGTLILAYGEAQNSGKELESLQKLWPVLEKYIQNGTLTSVGLSNVDTGVFIKLYQWAKIRPTIVQINLAMCCVVPPVLQEFTQQNQIQLLTHNDPYHILNKDSCVELFGDEAKLNWVAKYQVHIKCRGVLSSKGYFVNITK